MREVAELGCAPCPIFALHDAIIRGGLPNAILFPPLSVPHACERAAPGDSSLEVANVRRLRVQSGRLIVTAILFQQWNRVGIGTAIRCIRCVSRLLRLLSGETL